MTVCPLKRSTVSGALASRQRSGWLWMLALYVLVVLFMGMPTESRAQEEPSPSLGGAIVRDYFPDDPRSNDYRPDDPPREDTDDSDVFDENLSLLPANGDPFRFSGSLDVELPCGEPEIVRNVNLTKLITKNVGDRIIRGRGITLRGAHIEFDVSAIVGNCGSDFTEVIMVLAEGVTVEDADNFNQYNKLLRNSGRPPRELDRASDGSVLGFWKLSVDGVSYHTPAMRYDADVYNSSNVFLDMIASRKTYKVSIMSMDSNSIDGWRMTTGVFSVILRRPTTCRMQVEYRGDSINGSDFGDLAYYNNFLKEGSRFKEQGGVAVATGSAVDEKVLRLAERAGLVGGGGGAVYSDEEYQAMQGAEVDPFAPGGQGPMPTPPPSNRQPRSYGQHEFEDFASGVNEVPRSELETFGLSMAGRKINKRVGPNESFMAAVGGVVIEAASRAQLHELGGGSISLSRVRMSTKDRFDDGTPLWFSWNQGDPGEIPYISRQSRTTAPFSGTLFAHLKSEKRLPDGNYAYIDVTTRFIAAEGALGCEFGRFR